jgi:hypothetical protein
LYDQIRTKSSAPILQWIPPVSNGVDAADRALIKTACSNKSVFWIDGNVHLDATSKVGNPLSQEGLHPNVNGRLAIAEHMYSVLSGDTIGAVASIASHKAPLVNPIFTADASVVGTLSSTNASFVGGNYTITSFFGGPIVSLKDTGNASPQIQMYSSGISTFLGGSANAFITFGDGTSAVDTNLYRSAANVLKTDDNFVIGTAGTIAGSAATIDGTQTLTNKTLTSPVINTGVSGTAIDTDTTLAANSDTILASQKAVKSYTDRYRDVSLIADTGGSTFNTSVAETSLLNGGAFSVPAGTLKSTGDRLQIKLYYYQKNNSGAAVTFTGKFKFGGNSATAVNAFSQASNAFIPMGRVFATITRTSATTVLMEGLFTTSNVLNTAVAHQNLQFQSWTVANMDSNALTIDYTIQMGTSNAQAEIDPLLVTIWAERI